MMPMLKQLSVVYHNDEDLKNNNINIQVIDVDCQSDYRTCNKFGIHSYPQLYLFKGTQMVDHYDYYDRSTVSLDYFVRSKLNLQLPKETRIAPTDVTKDFVQEPNKNYFLAYKTAGCQGCKAIEVPFQQLATYVVDQKLNATVAYIDCSKNKSYCDEQNVTQFPQIYFISNNKTQRFYGSQTFNDMKNYLEDKVVTDSDLFNVTIEDIADKYNETLKQGITFVKYWMYWCWHCIDMQTEYKKLKLWGEKQQQKVNIVEVECNASKDICSSVNVTGYPTLVLYKDGEEIGRYDKAQRTAIKMGNWINELVQTTDLIKSTNMEATTAQECQQLIQKQQSLVILYYYEQNSRALQSKKLIAEFLQQNEWNDLKVVYVDCDKEGEFCKQNANGQLTIKLYEQGQEKAEYDKSFNSLDDLKVWIMDESEYIG